MNRTIRQMPLPGTPDPAPEAREAEHGSLARRAAAEGIVLLKNEDGVLPLAPGSTVALYGAGAVHTVKGGTGSGDVNERHSVTIREGMEAAGFRLSTADWLDAYENVYAKARSDWKQTVLDKCGGTTENGMAFFMAYSTTPFSLPAGPAVTPSQAETAVYVIARIAGEGSDRSAGPGDYCLSDEEHTMLADICRLYKNVVVLINAGGVVDLSFLDEFENIKGLLVVSQPGMEGGNAVADVLSGKVNPCGKLTDTWALHYGDYPNAATYSHNNGNVEEERYEEGLYVGYRYFDTFGIPVRYGFGEGGSYTTFAMEAAQPQTDLDGSVTVKVQVQNTGAVPGREVVQVYASLPQGRLEKEFRRLCAFAKTPLLQPGESSALSLTFTARDLASYDEASSAWVLEAGDYGIYAGPSLAAAKPVALLRLSEEKMLEKTENICPLEQELNLLHCPEEQQANNRAAVAEAFAQAPVIRYDLSAVETRVVDYAEPAPLGDEAEVIAATLTTEQMIALATGDPSKGQGANLGSAGISVPGSAGETSACALDRGVANIVLADGPAGLRLNQTYYVRDGRAQPMPMEASLEHGLFLEDTAPKGTPRYQFCTAFPVGTLLAQSWDTDLLEEVGRAVAREMDRFGVTLWLAPGMNLHRNPLCGRNFEYYAEDPLVSGKMAAAMTRGVQSVPGCGTTIKHFACNNQEDNRFHSDSILPERVLRELYLRGFGIAVQEASLFSIMTSYNLINGVHSANNYDLCTRAARREFGFAGFFMTDWTTTEQGPDCTADGCIRAGNDLVMPGCEGDHAAIRKALEDGRLTADQLRGCVTRMIRVILRSSRYENAGN